MFCLLRAANTRQAKGTKWQGTFIRRNYIARWTTGVFSDKELKTEVYAMEWKRTWMFVPGHRQRMIDKALGLSSDALILDIEDGVPPDEKTNARKLIAEALSRTHPAEASARFVRVNAIGHQRMEQDLDAVIAPGLAGLVLPKVETVEEVLDAANSVRRRESQRRIASESIKFVVAVESPRGLLNAAAIARCSPRVIGLMFGAE